MNDDIVMRLRFEYASCECSGIKHDCDRCETDKQAADEIERLRALVAAWKDVAQELTMYAAMQELKAAADE
jgi:hypothetical protein